MHQLVDRTTRTGAPAWDVVEDTAGLLLGRITQSRAARHGRAFFAALGPDKCTLVAIRLSSWRSLLSPRTPK
jgi:hypothetical protein